MSPFQPAVRAHQAKPYPVLNVDVQGEDENDSPGAGKALPYSYGDRLDDENEPTRPGSPVRTRINDAPPASTIGALPTSTTVVQVSTSTVTIVVPDAVSSSGSAFNATLPAVADSPDISPSPRPPSLSPLPPSSSPLSTSTTLSSPASTTPPSFVGMSPSPDVLAGSANGAKKSSGLSGGAIGAIVTVAVLALCALAFFIFRNRRIQKRMARRVTWTAGLAPRTDFGSSLEKGVGDVQPISSEASISATSQASTSGANGDGEAQPPVRNIARKPPLPYSPITPTAPPQTYNNPPHPTTPPVHPVAVHSVASSPSVQDMPVVVRVTFVPQLPDELAITPGETLHIRAEFDDGWALCVNTRGKQGMVPLECLDGDVDGPLTGPPRIGDWRSSRRASSLRSVATWS